jgi:Na+-transporting methylmalonyl-CoA/oxaloacetate decarboxylase gamma subunit
MFLTGTISENLGLLEAGVIALLGYAVVFFGLILLMIVVITLGKAFTAKLTKPVPAAPAQVAPVAPAAPVVAAPAADEAAPGSAGKLKLHNVEPKTAAMLMAIVANKMGKPLNELRFISIKEVE